MSAEPAFLLHRRPYRETSALVDLLTLNHGRIRAVAHGGQRPGSKSRQRLQPFTPLFVSWRGERELKRLVLMESRGQTALLAGEGLLCGLYANEIATRLLPLELAAPEVFAFYSALLDALPIPADRALALRRFEWALLETLEATPRFCTYDGAALDPQARYRFDAASRAFVPAEQGIEGRTLRYIDQGDWQPAGLASALKALMRAALAPHLGATALRSRELMLDLARRRQR
ncbi:DNA repair protein RecO [Halomonas venusta]|jgi:DNA repair protein RecO (recombination protein O)|uniref:DNA repair protein RecO n=1 Tax=Halomonas hydrothermalis TaxID=115561 RepID=A0A6F8U516_9GAMM|nr:MULTISPECIES: DNA repair protein RecO [Halomonas]MDW0358175.1 DNA repair protein RecO [Halomonas venusta]WAM47165.1 DNA repair protein RecO [Halomonas venusta]WAM50664.1 DNA repair protein RecO [Halomonas venusta]BCB08231.1 DNA repair protein RecO [Halomonas hydrothermalis]